LMRLGFYGLVYNYSALLQLLGKFEIYTQSSSSIVCNYWSNLEELSLGLCQSSRGFRVFRLQVKNLTQAL